VSAPTPPHPIAALDALANGRIPDSELVAHLESCLSCAGYLGSKVRLDLAYTWQGIAAELDAPLPSIGERLLSLLGVPPWLARFTLQIPSLRPAWLGGSTVVLALATLITILLVPTHARDVPALLVVVPALGAFAAAFASGRADPAYEIVVATPLSRTTALLARLGAVLLANAVLCEVATLIAGSRLAPEHRLRLYSALSVGRGTLAFGWLLPMAAVALVAAAVSARWRPITGAAVGGGAWLVLVALTNWASSDPAGALWGTRAEIAYAGAVLMLTVLLAWSRTRGPVLATSVGFD
jgi:hypothetical protein